MNDEIMVSINCLAYNHEKYIAKCLEGFISQKTNFKFEVLIHDDASTDNTASIIREYAQKYPDIIKPIYQTENQYSIGSGILKTFQYPRVKGKYVAFCEGDDYWCDDYKLQKQFDIMEKNPNITICVHKTEDILENGTSSGSFHPSVNLDFKEFSLDEYLTIINEKTFYPFQTSSYLVRKNVIDIIQSNSLEFYKICPVGDSATMLASLCIGDGYYINEIMSCYRLMSNSSWSKQVYADPKKRLIHFTRMYKTFELLNQYTNFVHNDLIEKMNTTNQFYIDLLSGNYKICLQRKNKTFMKELSKREKINVLVNAYFPFVIRIYKKLMRK